MEKQEKYIKQVEAELQGVVDMMEKMFEKGYAKKNPDMVRHLMDKIHDHKYLDLNKEINK